MRDMQLVTQHPSPVAHEQRDAAAVATLLDAGAERLLTASIALESAVPGDAGAAPRLLGDCVELLIDARDGYVRLRPDDARTAAALAQAVAGTGFVHGQAHLVGMHRTAPTMDWTQSMWLLALGAADARAAARSLRDPG